MVNYSNYTNAPKLLGNNAKHMINRNDVTKQKPLRNNRENFSGVKPHNFALSSHLTYCVVTVQ